MKLVLGTAQFGLDYGILNPDGQIGAEEALSILDGARGGGIDMLDTAIAYGNSEDMLGQLGTSGFSIITKLPSSENAEMSLSDWAVRQIEISCRRLGVNSVEAVLLHRPDELVGSRGEELAEALRQLKRQGLSSKTGISIYSPSQLDAIWPHWKPDIVQCPYNILDRRIELSGWAAKLAASGVELHLRSAFLQGLLLVHPDKLATSFLHWKQQFMAIGSWANERGLTAMQASLGCALGLEPASAVIVGVNSKRQLDEILNASKFGAIAVPESLSSADERLLNPTLWPTA
jgi:aryl-alcohol dehydrogenase-like predicted oxidoreductase